MVVGALIDAVTDNIPLGISLLAVLLPWERVGAGIATISAMMGVGAAVGLPLAGLIAQHLGYHPLFGICAAAGVLAAIAALAVPNRRVEAY
ncbi:MFS transporter [Pseudofrankia sp. BMG5.37]|uniref:MFS transporter n=1 Tax=Pseudofrankia sp. BMG5.37 TaxID=3050035 RepID=UPI0037C7E2F8